MAEFALWPQIYNLQVINGCIFQLIIMHWIPGMVSMITLSSALCLSSLRFKAVHCPLVENWMSFESCAFSKISLNNLKCAGQNHSWFPYFQENKNVRQILVIQINRTSLKQKYNCNKKQLFSVSCAVYASISVTVNQRYWTARGQRFVGLSVYKWPQH